MEVNEDWKTLRHVACRLFMTEIVEIGVENSRKLHQLSNNIVIRLIPIELKLQKKFKDALNSVPIVITKLLRNKNLIVFV